MSFQRLISTKSYLDELTDSFLEKFKEYEASKRLLYHCSAEALEEETIFPEKCLFNMKWKAHKNGKTLTENKKSLEKLGISTYWSHSIQGGFL